VHLSRRKLLSKAWGWLSVSNFGTKVKRRAVSFSGDQEAFLSAVCLPSTKHHPVSPPCTWIASSITCISCTCDWSVVYVRFLHLLSRDRLLNRNFGWLNNKHKQTHAYQLCEDSFQQKFIIADYDYHSYVVDGETTGCQAKWAYVTLCRRYYHTTNCVDVITIRQTVSTLLPYDKLCRRYYHTPNCVDVISIWQIVSTILPYVRRCRGCHLWSIDSNNFMVKRWSHTNVRIERFKLLGQNHEAKNRKSKVI